jgi:hypothetical protein
MKRLRAEWRLVNHAKSTVARVVMADTNILCNVTRKDFYSAATLLLCAVAFGVFGIVVVIWEMVG